MKFIANIEIEVECDEIEFDPINPEKAEKEKKNKYKNIKEELQKVISNALIDEFDDEIKLIGVRTKQVKVEYEKVNLQNDNNCESVG